MLNSSNPSFQSALKALDNIPTRYTNSVYVLYIKDGQSRAQDILANQVSWLVSLPPSPSPSLSLSLPLPLPPSLSFSLLSVFVVSPFERIFYTYTNSFCCRICLKRMKTSSSFWMDLVGWLILLPTLVSKANCTQLVNMEVGTPDHSQSMLKSLSDHLFITPISTLR